MFQKSKTGKICQTLYDNKINNIVDTNYDVDQSNSFASLAWGIWPQRLFLNTLEIQT